MKEITLKNFRCFHTEQKARLAPLTLLVGENNTGKTSLLAMIRALWDCVHGHTLPNFKASPFDLGSFEEMVHQQSERSKPASAFEINVQIDQGSQAEFVFKKVGTIPMPVYIRLIENGNWIEEYRDSESNNKIRVGTPEGTWELPLSDTLRGSSLLESRRFIPFFLLARFSDEDEEDRHPIPVNESPAFSKEVLDSIRRIRLMDYDYAHDLDRRRPFASSPVRSAPKRACNPATTKPDPEGDYIPMMFANLAIDNPDEWGNLKQGLEKFGSSAGIFDEIDVKRFAKSGSAPFHIQVRKYGEKRKEPKRNLIDVGYGISQVLPLVTELLQTETPRMALLQQPEVHLHPSAQAALGSLFCEIASQGRQLVIETHSDHLMDRVRMDIRDGKTNLKPEDVSILFFERNDLSVLIHSLRLDEEGNILDAPQSYRRFFMEEIRRSLGLF
ncbi:MAG: AAA family ATPase [Bacteroidetes bacterium]|nr:AAA family ATPase [Bacteroidota bacterium]